MVVDVDFDNALFKYLRDNNEIINIVLSLSTFYIFKVYTIVYYSLIDLTGIGISFSISNNSFQKREFINVAQF